MPQLNPAIDIPEEPAANIGSDQSDPRSLPETDSVLNDQRGNRSSLRDGSTKFQGSSVSISLSPATEKSESLSNTDYDNSRSLYIVNPAVIS